MNVIETHEKWTDFQELCHFSSIKLITFSEVVKVQLIGLAKGVSS